MKRSSIIILALVSLLLIGVLAGCSKKEEAPANTTTTTKAPETTTKAPETTTAAPETTTAAPETTTAAPETTTAAPETTTAAPETTTAAPETTTAAGTDIDTKKYMLYDTEVGLRLYMDRLMFKQDAESNGLTTFYANEKYMVAALREGFEIFDGHGLDTKNMTLEDYADLVKRANEYENDFTPDSYGNLRITYTSDVGGTDYFYYSTVRKGSDAFWLIHFACLDSDRATFEPIFEMLGNTAEVD